MKRILIASVSILVVLFAGLLVAPSFFDWNQYKPQASQMIKDKTGIDVALNGDLKIAIFPTPYAYVNDVVVKSPKAEQYENIATLQRLDLHLAVGPLLSGKVEMTSLELVKPAIFIETFADGSQNWKTAQIEALMSGDKMDDAAQGEQAAPDQGAMDSVSLNNLGISDGRIALYDHKAGAEQVFENINLDVKADTLSGPFAVDGGIILSGRSVKFNAKTGRLSGSASSVPLNAEVRIMPDDVTVKYSGVVDLEGAFEVQGETQIVSSNIASVLAQMGVASPVLKDAALDAKGILTASAEKFSFRNAAINIGQGRFQGSVDGALNPMSLALDLQSTQPAFGSFVDIPELAKAQNIAFKGVLGSENGATVVRDMSLTLDDTQLSGALVFKPGADKSKPSLAINIASERFDANKFMAQSGSKGVSSGASSASKGGDLKSTLSGIDIPVNLDFNVSLKEGRYDKYSFEGVSAKGTVNGNAINIAQLSVNNFAQSKINLVGKVDNYKTLSGVDGTLSVSSPNIRALADALAVDVAALPADLQSLDLALQGKGSADAMDVTANVKALNGEVIASGGVGNLLGTMTISDLDVQIKHPNVNKALDIVSPGSGTFADFNKPLDFYVKVAKNDKGYNLSGIKANIAGIAAEGSAGMDLSGARPNITADLKLGDVTIGNKVAGGSSAGAGESAPAAKGWSREAIDSSWMKAFDFTVNVAAKSINYQGWNMAQPVLKAALNNGTMTLEQLQAGLYDGQVNLSGTMKQANANTGYAVNGTANLRDVSLEPLVGSLTGNRILKGRGLISADVDVSAGGISPASLVNSINGKGVTAGKEIVLTGFDLARFARALSSETKPGDTVLGVWKSASKGGSTEFDTMDGEFTISEGIVNISKLDLDGPKALMTTAGHANIPQFTIATTHEITLKEEDIPPFKIEISGPLNNPANTFGQGVLNDYISRKVERKLQDLLSDKLGDKLGLSKPAPVAPVPPADGTEGAPSDNGATAQPQPQQQQQQSPAEVKPEEAIKGLLKGLLR